MELANLIVGLPWQLAKPKLQAACIPFRVTIGVNYNKFFDIAHEGLYVARVQQVENVWDILLYRPMINSDFEKAEEVAYAEEFSW